jgi:hypothetical protein
VLESRFRRSPTIKALLNSRNQSAGTVVFAFANIERNRSLFVLRSSGKHHESTTEQSRTKRPFLLMWLEAPAIVNEGTVGDATQAAAMLLSECLEGSDGSRNIGSVRLDRNESRCGAAMAGNHDGLPRFDGVEKLGQMCLCLV